MDRTTKSARRAHLHCFYCEHFNHKYEVCELWEDLQEEFKEYGAGMTFAEFLDDVYELSEGSIDACEDTKDWYREHIDFED